MRFLSRFAIIVVGVAGLLGACGKGGGGTSTSGGITCDPGENIFCRCPGGEAGTKTCKDDGHSFEACVTREGPCPEIPSTTSSSSAESSASSSSGGGMGGMGTGGGAAGGYLASCAKDEDCQSAKCRYGYCTMDCAKFDECTLGVGECIAFSGEQLCMPVCTLTGDCLDAYGNPSACGYTTAVDGTPVTTCCDWLTQIKVPPEGTNCADDISCNLGNEGVQSVCSFEVCTKGCYMQSDCPVNTTCSSNGLTLGGCK
ncbi:MAG: hypothetical protein QM820_13890 [Minicystis sp.]